MHLTGAVYAETFLTNAAADNLCVNTATLSFTKNAGTTRSLPAQPVCAEGNVAAASVFKNQKLYDALVDSFSMRSFVPSSGISGHDQFFATFDRFSGTSKVHLGEWLDEVATRAASQNEQYLEIMQTPGFANAAKLGYQFGWPDHRSHPGRTRLTSATSSSPPASATKSLPIAKSSPPPSPLATESNTAASLQPQPPAPQEFASSARSSAPSPRNRSSPRPSSTSSWPLPIPT